MKHINFKQKKAFTLVEVLVTVGIIAVLAAVSIPILTGILSKSNEKLDDLNATEYSSCMAKFASESPDSAKYSKSISAFSPEQQNLITGKAGNNLFPGYAVDFENGTTDDEKWEAIRSEAITAIELYTDTKVLSGNYIPSPSKSDYEYVYYYLTGAVKMEKKSEMIPMTEASITDGSVDANDYWVFLSCDGGSGDIATLTQEGQLWIKLIQFGTGNPMGNEAVSIKGKYQNTTKITEPNGYVVFQNIKQNDVTSISVTGPTIVDYPSDVYDNVPNSGNKTDNPITIPKNGDYKGNSYYNPIVISIIQGSLGGMKYQGIMKTWNGTSWSTSNFDLSSDTIDANFTKTTSLRDEQYKTIVSSTKDSCIQNFLGENNGKFRFLMFDGYNLSITSSKYRTYTEGVTSYIWGIYNTNNPQTQFKNATEKYNYPISLRFNKTLAYGKIEWENGEQILNGQKQYATGVGNGLQSNQNYNVTAKVIYERKDGKIFESNVLSNPQDGKYYYNIENIEDGVYSVYLKVFYGETGSQKLFFNTDSNGNNLLTNINITDTSNNGNVGNGLAGCHLVIDGKVDFEEVSTVPTYSVKTTMTYSGTAYPIENAQVTLSRLGYTDKNYTLNTSDVSGIAKFTNIPKGFYKMTIKYPPATGVPDREIPEVIIDEPDKKIVIDEKVKTINISGIITPLKHNNAIITNINALGEYKTLPKIAVNVNVMSNNKTNVLKSLGANIAISTTNGTATYKITVPALFTYKISSSISCYTDGSLTVENKNCTNLSSQNFNVIRHEDKGAACDSEHADKATGNWKYRDCGNGTHDYYCERCGFIKSNGTHAINYKAISPKSVTGNNTNVNTQHTKYCSYCTYSVTENCGNGSWTYNYYNGNGSPNYHYGYCKNCRNRYVCASHAMPGWSYNSSSHWQSCSKSCGYSLSANHDFSVWHTTSYSTCTTNGSQYRKCNTCGYTETQSLALLGHDFSARCNVQHEFTRDSAGILGGNGIKKNSNLQGTCKGFETYATGKKYYVSSVNWGSCGTANLLCGDDCYDGYHGSYMYYHWMRYCCTVCTRCTAVENGPVWCGGVLSGDVTSDGQKYVHGPGTWVVTNIH